jgi:hypothetical protein
MMDLKDMGVWRYCLIFNPEHKTYGIGEDFRELGYTVEIPPEYESKEDLITALELMLRDLHSKDMPFRLDTGTYRLVERNERTKPNDPEEQ